MESVSLNWVAIMVAAFVAYVLGAIWYSPVMFVKPWMRLIGVPEAEMNGPRPGFAVALVLQALVTVVQAAVLAVIIDWAGVTNPFGGAAVALLVAFGLIAADHLKLMVFEKRPFMLVVINNGYTAAGLLLMGLIIGAGS